MKQYIFYTVEGFTQAPNMTTPEGDIINFDVENCQLLGRAKGKTAKEACMALLAENTWIEDYGFSPSEIIAQEVIGETFCNLI